MTEASRSEQRAKRRKTNLILNSMILIVLLLIVIVSFNIFGKDAKTEAGNPTEQTVANTNEELEAEEQLEEVDVDEDTVDKDNTEDQNASEEAEQGEQESVDETEEIEEDQVNSNENDEKSIKDPNWKPVGTKQVEPAQDYNIGSVDWNEQLKAVSDATGFNQSKGDILKMLQNNGPKKSKATIIIKESNKKYQVYLEWVDGGGWKPALVEELPN